MLVKTEDLNEASWYVMNGGIIKEVTFGKVQPNKRTKGYTTAYHVTVEGIEPRFVNYWKMHNPFGNIRTFSEVRQNLKRKIQKLERKRE